jgi:hypothetical protein
MAKKVIKESKEELVSTENKDTQIKKVPEQKAVSMSVEDLVKQLKDKEQLKTVIENQYHQLCGQIQLLVQMINSLQEKR